MQEVFEKIINRIKESSYLVGEGEPNAENIISEYNAINIVKQAAEEYNNGWISVDSEEKPREGRFYSVTLFDGEEYRTEPAYYARIGYLGQSNIKPNWWTDCTSNTELIEKYGDKVIAWQPLLQPYQPKGECE